MNFSIFFPRWVRIIAVCGLLLGIFAPLQAEKLVILHTNDTHSQIDPIEDSGLGGILRRKAAIDSIRAAEPNVLLIDAGDAVQGSLFYYLFKGDVEAQLMNAMGTDMGILGNHDFDNGMDNLRRTLLMRKDQLLSTNYFFEDEALDSLFAPYTIREIGGKRIGFLGINLQPQGMISPENYPGVDYDDALELADLTAEYLKRVERADMVIAITHIGYDPETGDGDRKLASESEYIDIIIGGHSHTVIDPATVTGQVMSSVKNDEGQPVLIAQAGKGGAYLGQIDIELDSLNTGRSRNGIRSKLLKIDSHYDAYAPDTAMLAIIERYRPGVDSLLRVPVTRSSRPFKKNGVQELNYMADFIYDRGSQLAGAPVDFAIVNKGGLRTNLEAGMISEGNIINLLPFLNRIVVIDVPGKSLHQVFNAMAKTDGNGVSSHISARYDADLDVTTFLRINGKELEDDRTYRIATIDYLAKGGDYMTGLTEGTIVAAGEDYLYDELIKYLRPGGAGAHKAFGKSSTKPRMVPERN